MCCACTAITLYLRCKCAATGSVCTAHPQYKAVFLDNKGYWQHSGSVFTAYIQRKGSMVAAHFNYVN